MENYNEQIYNMDEEEEGFLKALDRWRVEYENEWSNARASRKGINMKKVVV